MDDNTLKTNLKNVLGPGLGQVHGKGVSPKIDPNAPSFKDTLSESIKQVDSLQKEADQAIEKLVSGESQNVHGAMLAVSKADLAFQMTMQVRNKIVEAYQEVMRMQV
ncbi:flagellar hook-basal body complex protein FliE [Nitrospina watsonii]|uniref:Flagellar hook-basal body complex protein FliE n=1 Tax=Nitrospina watsonii TaxID=1323948 RepID=A0ABN8W4Z5_9BACT|nr:flagellar hook-basal body complex protein FliE [Nitrospina watsonii]CAI2718428.1 Flagellar hook-basal body complex protein FliE [Nitrospina watsonii]